MNAVRVNRIALQHVVHPSSRKSPTQRYISVVVARKNYSNNSHTPTLEIAGITAQDVHAARTYCLDLLRKYDAPSYTLRAFISSSAQDAYLSLRALNVDVARIADATSNPTVGTFRMQFWRDSITRALALTPPKEPVAILLANAVANLSAISGGRARLSKSWLHRLVNTREARLQNPPFPSLAALETYAENTYSTLLYLTLSALPLGSVTADHVASHIGKAQGIAAVLRGLPFLAFPPPPPTHHPSNAVGGPLPGAMGSARQGSVPLPLDVMAEFGVREEMVYTKGGEAEGLRDAVFAVATRANDHLITAREMLKNVRAGQDVGHEFEHGDDLEHERDGVGEGVIASGGKSTAGMKQNAEIEQAFGVFMPAVSTQMWLDRLQKADFNIFDAGLRKAEWSLPWKAYWAYNRRSF